MKKKQKLDQSKNNLPAGRGLNIYYYGKGKGKTTAAMGLAVRAAGAGMDVFILQFVKAKRPAPGKKLSGGEWPVSSEILFFEAVAAGLPGRSAFPSSQKSAGSNLVGGSRTDIGIIDTEQAGAGFVGILGDKKQKRVHVAAAKKALAKAAAVIRSGKYALVILDELVSAVELGLISKTDVVRLLAKKPKHIHVAYTGHDRFDEILKISDLVSEITMVKHPYYQGILAQRGIDF